MNEMCERIAGHFSVSTARGMIQDSAIELCAELTAGGDPLLVLDAAACFEPRRMSQARADLARHLHVLHISGIHDLEEVWTGMQALLQKHEIRQVVVVGLLRCLYDPNILTRDASRTLGQIKSRFEALTGQGLDVTVVCEPSTGNLGTRAHFLTSLQTLAHR